MPPERARNPCAPSCTCHGYVMTQTPCAHLNTIQAHTVNHILAPLQIVGTSAYLIAQNSLEWQASTDETHVRLTRHLVPLTKAIKTEVNAAMCHEQIDVRCACMLSRLALNTTHQAEPQNARDPPAAARCRRLQWAQGRRCPSLWTARCPFAPNLGATWRHSLGEAPQTTPHQAEAASLRYAAKVGITLTKTAMLTNQTTATCCAIHGAVIGRF
jgi:hypothetical protein